MCVSQGTRVVITGKGGAGKTTLTSCLSRVLSGAGGQVLAVDADPQMNLAYALGLDPLVAASIVPLSDNADYVEEKTGVRPGPGSFGAMFKLNPDVADVVDRFGCKVSERVGVLVMGTVKQAGGGCLCAENVLLDSTMGQLVLRDDDFVLLDTQAGVEHFGRGIARGFGKCLVVSDDTYSSLSVAYRSAALARQSGILDVILVVNRARDGSAERLDRFGAQAGEPLERRFNAVVTLPLEPRLLDLDPGVSRILEVQGSSYAVAVEALATRLEPRDCGCASRRRSMVFTATHSHPHRG